MNRIVAQSTFVGLQWCGGSFYLMCSLDKAIPGEFVCLSTVITVGYAPDPSLASHVTLEKPSLLPRDIAFSCMRLVFPHVLCFTSCLSYFCMKLMYMYASTNALQQRRYENYFPTSNISLNNNLIKSIRKSKYNRDELDRY